MHTQLNDMRGKSNLPPAGIEAMECAFPLSQMRRWARTSGPRGFPACPRSALGEGATRALDKARSTAKGLGPHAVAAPSEMHQLGGIMGDSRLPGSSAWGGICRQPHGACLQQAAPDSTLLFVPLPPNNYTSSRVNNPSAVHSPLYTRIGKVAKKSKYIQDYTNCIAIQVAIPSSQFSLPHLR